MRSRFPNKWLPYLLLLPTLALCAIFLYYPVIQTFRLSTYRAILMGLHRKYVGFENYVRLFTSSDYIHSLTITFIFAVGVVVLGLSISLAIALLANHKIRGARFYRLLLIWPYALSPAVAGSIWLFLLNPTAGVVNYFMKVLFGISPDWLTDGRLALLAVTIAAMWKNLGYNIVFFLAGLQNLPGEILEAAKVDGAGPWTTFWRVTFPLLSPTTFFLLIMNLIYAFFGGFGLIMVMTEGGPNKATNILIFNLYQDAFRFHKWGLAAAQSVILFIMVVALTLIQFRTTGRRVHYGGQ
ncbi:MAG: sugar ABC transporter permease [Caldiserica bacterium]|nr:sugar ABC transporter permease [Caldisericota bacterium]